MDEPEPTTKELVLNVLNLLGDDADMDEVIERLCFVSDLQKAIAAAHTGKSYTQEEAKQMMARWLK